MNGMDPAIAPAAKARLSALLALTWATLGPRLRWPLAGAAGFILVSSALQALAPLALRGAVDAITAKRFATAAAGIGLYAAIQGMARVAHAVLGLSYGHLWRRLQRSLSHLVYRHVLSLPHSYHVTRRTGELDRIIADGLNGVHSIITAFAFGIAPVLLQLVLIGGVLANAYQPALLLVLLAFAIGYGVVFHRGTLSQRNMQREAARAGVEAAGVATDALLNHETVRLFRGEAFIADRMDDALARCEAGWLGYFRAQAVNRLVLAGLFTAALGALLLLSVHEVAIGAMTAGGFVLVNTYLLQIIAPIERLGLASRELSQGLVYLERVGDLMAETPEAAASGGCQVCSGSGPLSVRIENLWFGYQPDRPVLRGVSLALPASRTVAVVGTSGSGKSTLVRLLFRLYQPDQGQILIGGTPIQSVDLGALRDAIAIVPQDTVLFNDTLQQNVAFGRPGASLAEIEAAATAAGLAGVVAALPDGWDTVVGERGLRLSGGERQRVAIARTVLKRPRLFIFDEATSAMDTRTERAIQDSLAAASRGTTTLIIAHRLSTVRDADEILVLHDGQVAEQGSHRTLLAKGGLYAAMWAAQAEYDAATGPDAGSPSDNGTPAPRPDHAGRGPELVGGVVPSF
jgi:ABC-type transport system involved in Fe-S cluster assembly fused permease/ATPase subunit